MSGLMSLYACAKHVLGSGFPFSLNDHAFVKKAADTWRHTMNSTTVNGNAYILWASALLLHLINLYSLSSDVFNIILIAYEQSLQEAGGEDVTLKAAAHMADNVTGHHEEHAYVIILPSGLPAEMRQTAPEHFLVADSGATVHCLWDSICTAYLTEQNSSINWGGADSRSVCIAIGHLCGVTFSKDSSDNWSKVIITSGAPDAWVIPNSSRMLFSQIRAKLQGHRCFLDGPNPGMLLGDTGDFIPFVIEEETQFCLFPMYPPPTTSARHADLYSSSMRVINMEKCGLKTRVSNAVALAFSPLVSKILLKRSAVKRAKAADRKMRQKLLRQRTGTGLRNNDFWSKSVNSQRKRSSYGIARIGQIMTRITASVVTLT